MTRLLLFLALCLVELAGAADAPLHGLWVWNVPAVLDTAAKVEGLRDFCHAAGVTEVYLSVSRKDFAVLAERLPEIIAPLHQAGLQVEALLDSIDADEPGIHRYELLRHVEGLIAFNQQHPETRFDGIHLDIEPHQRSENKGAGNLGFLPGLIETFRRVTERASAAGLTTNADIANKFLKGEPAQRRQLLTSVSRVTLMLYELNSPTDGKSLPQKIDHLRQLTDHYYNLAYTDLPEAPGESGQRLAKMAIALRTPDYLEFLPTLLATLDPAQQANPHYLGWSLHSYNDHLPAAP